MATCKLNRNILRTTTCSYSLPKVTDIWVAPFEDISTSASTDTAGCESITALTVASGAGVSHIQPAKDSTNFSDSLQVGDAGNKYRTHSISFNISAAYDACMHTTLDDLALGLWFVVVKTAEGQYLALGRQTGLEAQADGANVAGGSDTNGISITLSNDCAESAMPLAEAAVTSLLAAEFDD